MITIANAAECPCCGAVFTNITGLDTDRKPEPGDITLCIRCGAICQFDKDMAMVLHPEPNHPDLADARKLQAHIREMVGLPVVDKTIQGKG